MLSPPKGMEEAQGQAKRRTAKHFLTEKFPQPALHFVNSSLPQERLNELTALPTYTILRRLSGPLPEIKMVSGFFSDSYLCSRYGVCQVNPVGFT